MTRTEQTAEQIAEQIAEQKLNKKLSKALFCRSDFLYLTISNKETQWDGLDWFDTIIWLIACDSPHNSPTIQLSVFKYYIVVYQTTRTLSYFHLSKLV